MEASGSLSHTQRRNNENLRLTQMGRNEKTHTAATAVKNLLVFPQALLLDADALPLRDPTYLFESPEFQAHGSLFFPDWWTHDGKSSLGILSQAYEIFKLAPPWETSKAFLATESGALLLDR
jgi:hypothetical protein